MERRRSSLSSSSFTLTVWMSVFLKYPNQWESRAALLACGSWPKGLEAAHMQLLCPPSVKSHSCTTSPSPRNLLWGLQSHPMCCSHSLHSQGTHGPPTGIEGEVSQGALWEWTWKSKPWEKAELSFPGALQLPATNTRWKRRKVLTHSSRLPFRRDFRLLASGLSGKMHGASFLAPLISSCSALHSFHLLSSRRH